MDEKPDTMSRSQRRQKVITDNDRILYLMDEISRGARRVYDARVARIGLNQTQWRIIGQLLAILPLRRLKSPRNWNWNRRPSARRLQVCARGLMKRLRAETDRRAWQLILTEQLDDLLPELRGSADRLHDLLWRDIAADEKRTLQQILERVSENLDQHRAEAE